MTEQDLQELESAARMIIAIIQRNRIHNENAELRRSQFSLFINKEQQEEKKANNQWGILEFTEKEIFKMPKKFRKEFRVGTLKAHVRLKPTGVYEIRICINGHTIATSSKLLDVAKEKFIERLKTYIPVIYGIGITPTPQTKKDVTIGEYLFQWLETAKKISVKENTYKDYLLTYRVHINPNFGQRLLSDVTQFELQMFLNSLIEQGKNRTAKKIHLLMNAMFEYALNDDLIKKNPMKRIVIPRYEQEHGQPLSFEEERILVNKLYTDGDTYTQAFVFLLYTGLRRSELASVEIKNEWITLTTSKQRKGLKEKTRSLPISPMLAPLMPMIDIQKIKNEDINLYTKWFKRLFPSHHLHDTRHTFITRAQECGIPRELVSYWAGHQADTSTTSLVYTHFGQNREFQLKEMQKFCYDI